LNTPDPPTLTDSRGLGGVIAQDGFDFQLWYALSRVPIWLSNPAFEGVILEGLEDVEARFFAAHADHYRLLERYQVKSGALTPAAVREVFEEFQRFERHYPRTARVQALISASLPSTLRWLARDTARVCAARPFYAPFSDIARASDARLLADLQETFGTDLGRFVAESVEVSELLIANREIAFGTFSAAFGATFPQLEEVSQKSLRRVFDDLCRFAEHNRGTLMQRAALLAPIEQEIGKPLLSATFPLHVRSDRNESNERALEIDASEFSGADGQFPSPAHWRTGLVMPLDATARWLRQHQVTRVALTGSYRLTTGLVLGWSLRSAIGFEIEIGTRSGVWLTDDRPQTDQPQPAWRLIEAQVLDGDRLRVCVGVLRDPLPAVVHAHDISPATILSLMLDQPISSGHVTQASVAAIKNAVVATVSRLKPAHIALYFAGPASLAVALGHRWNSLPPTQLHEFRAAQGDYVATALIGALP